MFILLLHTGDDSMGAGKVVGIVFGVGAVAAIVGIALWALNRSSPVLCESRNLLLFQTF